MIEHADCLDWLPTLAENSVDACVTDPPYGLEFMGKEWDKLNVGKVGNPALMPTGDRAFAFDGRDNVGGRLSRKAASPVPKKNPRCRRCGMLRFTSNPCQCDTPDWDTRTAEYGRDMQSWHEAWAREVYRVLKPGAHLLAFGGSRTYHRLVCAIEDAGFEIRDTIGWVYGQGFPKSKSMRDIGMPGWGTALKPAMELICVARKPLSEKTVAANVLRWGTGGLNVDGCRIPGGMDDTPESWAQKGAGGRPGANGYAGQFSAGMKEAYARGDIPLPSGRWPANLVLDEEAAACMDEAVGDGSAGGTPPRRPPVENWSGGWRGNDNPTGVGRTTGGPSRFFYCAKASRREREAGCEGLGEIVGKRTQDGGDDTRGRPEIRTRNHHPTVKPLALMRWLCRLVTPPGGTVLDPFAGSGSTLIAAGLEGFLYLGCEKDEEYVRIADARIAHWLTQERAGEQMSLVESHA